MKETSPQNRRQFMTGAAAMTALLAFGPESGLARTVKGVSYGPNKLDIYPATGSGNPVVVYVHGGAWRAGSRGTVGSMPAHFNGRGQVFVSVGYTLHPAANVAKQARQVGAAIQWIQANIAQYGGDPGRIAVMGHSAGCHLASLAILSGVAPNVRGLVANDTGAYDVSYLASINNNRLPILYAAPFKDRAQWVNWSPISYAGGAGQLPVFVAWSGGRNRDRISKRFADKLQAAGHPVTRFDGSRYNHMSIRGAVGRNNELTSAIDRFLGQVL